jgi:hypothetical protein
LLIPISLAACGLVLEATILRRRAVSPMLFGVVLVMLLAVYSSVLAIGMPVLERARPTAAIAENLRPKLTAHDQIGCTGSRNGASACVLSRAAGQPPAGALRRQEVFDQEGRHSDPHEDFARLRKDG